MKSNRFIALVFLLLISFAKIADTSSVVKISKINSRTLKKSKSKKIFKAGKSQTKHKDIITKLATKKKEEKEQFHQQMIPVL